MTRDLARSLLFSGISAGLIFLLCISFCTTGYVIRADSGVTVTPDPITVEFEFDKPKGEVFNQEKTITVTNGGRTTISVEISHTSGGITISSPSYLIPVGETKDITLTITADSNVVEGQVPPFKIKVAGKDVTVNVNIAYHAKLVVSSKSIDFRHVHRDDNPKEQITIREVYGYKNVNIETKKSGNDWLKIVNLPTQIKKGSSAEIEFTLTPGIPDHNEYSWEYQISPTTGNTEIRPSSIIDIEAYILMPPKLDELRYDKKLEIKFDKPKGTVSSYERTIEIKVRNKGDEQMDYTCDIIEKSTGINLNPQSLRGSVSGKSSKKIKFHITAPYNAPEGAYRVRLRIDATDMEHTYNAGKEYAYITITVLWPVDFTISSTSPYFRSSPLSIDFGSLELKERDYDKKKLTLTLTEYYRYKPIENLRFSSSDEHSDWVKEERDFVEIPPGGTGNIILKIEPGLEAVPKHYSWKHYLSAREISAKRMDITAKIVPMNISEMIERLKAFRKSPSYKSYPSSENIISNGIDMLVKAEQSEIGAEDWKKIPVLTKGSLSLLSSLNDCIISNEKGNYRQVVEDLWTVWVSTSRIDSNSKLSNRDVSGYAKGISIGADKTTEEVLTYEAKMLELRGWNIKKAVEHAIPTNDISVLNEEENVLESALSYQYAATLYGLLNDKKKRLDCVYEESRMMDKHDELVSEATDLRIRAETIILNAKENDLNRLWNTHLLSNPYDYDTASDSYKTAEGYLEDASKKYRFAGELIMAEDTLADLKELRSEWRYILSLFLLMCLVYGAAVIYVLNRIIRGTMAYMDDMREREVGDVVVS